ncbi:MAG: isoprenylcysteine carboxylmethyltransferase family protein [Acidimicrobiales bacterium]|jgi:protein-S-isoprenylcysteine O-methyltransferase Ste14|nr:isoprenylcysteine carboxylmethyltransferase family protein [Acidimicrobiales bacterium]
MSLFSTPSRRETATAWAFVAIQAVLLVAVLALPAGDAWVPPAGVATAARVVQWVGLGFLALGLLGLGISLSPLPLPVPHGRLHTGGVYRLVRHPIYTGVLGLALGSAVASGSPWVAGAALGLLVLFHHKARFEEAQLVRRYPEYAAYAARTPRFLPVVGRRPPVTR